MVFPPTSRRRAVATPPAGAAKRGFPFAAAGTTSSTDAVSSPVMTGGSKQGSGTPPPQFGAPVTPGVRDPGGRNSPTIPRSDPEGAPGRCRWYTPAEEEPDDTRQRRSG